MDMKGKVVVVTGASSGIGRATAHAFAKEGAQLVLAARSSDQLEEVERECADLGVRAVAVPTDVGVWAEVEELAARAERDFGGFDAWVNDAGVMLLGRIDEAPVEDFERVIRTNLLGTSYGSRVAITHFRKKKRGVLVNVSSIVGGMGQVYSSAYVASKWGVRGLGEALRLELTDEPGIHVCTVMPASIDTPIFQHAANYMGHDIKALAPVYPPEQVAGEIVRLMSHPKAEVTVGDAGRILQAASGLMPAAVRDRLARLFQEQGLLTPQIEDAHSGNLHDSSGPTAAVHGGWEDRVLRGATADRAMRLVGLGVAGCGFAYLLAALRPGRGHAAGRHRRKHRQEARA
jgi:NAD(P)-dependent dehydrogenase (short-subunit alcohol dehydrogenase family)